MKIIVFSKAIAQKYTLEITFINTNIMHFKKLALHSKNVKLQKHF